jgi:GNAT superfamily N-acetyltransferase
MGLPAAFVTAPMSTENPQPSPGSPMSASARSQKWAWVPIRSLGPRQRSRIAAHLLELNETDRYLRFGYPATDAQLNKYVDLLDFDRDEIFGIFNRRLELIAMAHLAYASPSASTATQTKPPMAEFGVSVLSKARGRGYGARLFDHATLHARNRNVETLFIHALSENVAMLRIARQAGALVERDGSESEAWLKLPPETIASQLEAAVEEQAAELDYQFKVQAHRVHELFDVMADLKSHLTGKALNEKS